MGEQVRHHDLLRVAIEQVTGKAQASDPLQVGDLLQQRPQPELTRVRLQLGQETLGRVVVADLCNRLRAHDDSPPVADFFEIADALLPV